MRRSLVLLSLATALVLIVAPLRAQVSLTTIGVASTQNFDTLSTTCLLYTSPSPRDS